MRWVSFVSDFGDSAVLLPLALVLAAALWRYQSSRAAVYFFVATGACLMIIVCLKMAFVACGAPWNIGIVSPSGHASMSTTVYGALGIVAARQAPQWQRPIILAAIAAFVGCVALSRIALKAHSIPEVTLGVVVGAIAVLIFAHPYLRLRTGRMNFSLLGSAVILVLLLLHGVHLPVEAVIRHLAFLSRTSLHACLDS